MELYFSESKVRDIADNVASAAEAFERTQKDLDASIQQLRNAAFQGIVGDEVLDNYENVVKVRIAKLITRANEHAKDLYDTIDMMVEAGLASP